MVNVSSNQTNYNSLPGFSTFENEGKVNDSMKDFFASKKKELLQE